MTQPVAQVRHVVARTGFANPLTLQILVADEDYLRVFADDTELNVGDDYVIAGIGNPNGVAITIIGADDVNAYAGVESFTAVYQPPLDQLASLSTGGGIGRPFETALDQQNRRLQSIGGRVDRALKVPVYVEGDIELPPPVNGGVLVWDDDEGGFVWGVPGGVPGAWATQEEAIEGLRLDRVMSPGRTRDFVETYAPPLDEDLSEIAALNTQPFGRDLLTMDTAEATRVRLRQFDTVADLFADTDLTYSAGLMQVAAGDIVEAQGFRYEVAASGATDHHVETAGGVKLYVVPAPIPNALEFSTTKKAIETKTGITNALIVPLGAHTLTEGADITAYSLIHGFGDMSQIVVPAGETGIAYVSHSGVFDDHPHNTLRDLRLTGDGTFASFPNAQNGTSTGASFATVANIGSLGSAEGVVFERHNVGRHIDRSYGHNGRRNYYRANQIGLLLDRVTSFYEYDIYARYNSTAAVRVIGGQNVSFIGGAIEGNPGKGLEYIDNGLTTWGQINLTDMYFESNGNQATGVWSIDIPRTAKLMTNIKGGNYWNNVASGVASGPYNLGPSVSLEGVTLNGSFYADEVVGYKNCRGPGFGVWNSFGSEALSRLYGLREPALFHEFKPALHDYSFPDTNSAGFVLRTRLMGRGDALLPLSPNDINATYPYGFTASSGATGSENSGLDYGEGSFFKVQFAASVGNFSSNYVTLASFSVTTKPFRTFCFLAAPEQDCEIGIIMSVGGAAVQQYFKLLAGETYRIVVAAHRAMSAGSFLRVFPLDAAGAAVNFLPIWKSAHSRLFEQVHIIGLLVDGVI